MAAIGFLGGPVHQIFFGILERFYPGKSVAATWRKVLLDQLISGPVFNFNFFVGMGLLEGKTIQEAWQEFLRKFPAVFCVGNSHSFTFLNCHYVSLLFFFNV